MPTTDVSADPWNESRNGDFLWTNTNVGEAIPDVMTPATWSMVQVFLRDAMATASIPPFIGYGRIGGRIYLNVSVMKTLSGAFGVSERHFRELSEEVFGRLPDDLEIPPVKASRLPIIRGDVNNAAPTSQQSDRPTSWACCGARCSTRNSTASAGCCQQQPGPAAPRSSRLAGGCSDWPETPPQTH